VKVATDVPFAALATVASMHVPHSSSAISASFPASGPPLPRAPSLGFMGTNSFTFGGAAPTPRGLQGFLPGSILTHLGNLSAAQLVQEFKLIAFDPPTSKIGVWRIEPSNHYALLGLIDGPIVTVAAEQAKLN
jgi:hypothetical protein